MAFPMPGLIYILEDRNNYYIVTKLITNMGNKASDHKRSHIISSQSLFEL